MPRTPQYIILTEYIHHVTTTVWAGEERPELKLSSHGRNVQKFGRPAPKIEDIVAATGLSPLTACSLNTSDRGLIYAFAERWHKETSSFHLPIGEVTITLDDVASLLHLPITSVFHTFDALHVDQAADLLVELLEASTQETKDETFQFHGAYCWTYEHFPIVVSCVANEDYHEMKPRACRWKSGKELLTNQMGSIYCDTPTKESYVTTIPPHSAALSLSKEEIDDRWMQFSEYLAPVGQICVASR
ncbi:Protein MAIN-LIKE 1 [Glycine soja]